jgi:regulator of replication initiation timing
VKKKQLKEEVEDLRSLLKYQVRKNMALSEENDCLNEELETLSMEYELLVAKSNPHTLWEKFKAERGVTSD